MKLTIVIPALNEEEAIGAIIERSLAARRHITTHAPVDDVEIIVVSDGSTDRTADIAARYDEVDLVIFERNRGYGAAIKRGFEEGVGELVGFLDADGTCDPTFFAELCTALIEEDAAIALGSRMGPASRMPRIRRLGNRIYAVILSALSNKVVTDTASGMRVLRRDVLQQLYPLPDGLHFTPAMTARALMDDHLHLIERVMPYEERIGDSKLNVCRDGVRFLRTILEMTLMWQPSKLFLYSAVMCLGAMTLLTAAPLELWLREGHLQEDMIYRLLFCSTLGAVGASLLSAALVAHHIHALIERRTGPGSFRWCLLDRLHSPAGIGVTVVLSTPLLLWLVGQGLWTWVTQGYVAIHWSRVVLAGLLLFGLVQMVITGLIINILNFHTRRGGGARRATARGEMHGRIVRSVATPTVEPVSPRSARPAPAGPQTATL